MVAKRTNEERFKLLLDMDGCRYLKPPPINGTQVLPVSICWKCKRKVSKCRWLLWGMPYKGSSYYAYLPRPSNQYRRRDTPPMAIYSIAECPMYIPPEEKK